MERLIAELKQIVRFKDSTDRGDLVLIVAKEPQVMVSYALVTDIVRDTSRRDEWWNVSLIVLSIPPQEMTWTLRTPQLTGMEVFTMGGEERFVKAVDMGTMSLPTQQVRPVTVPQEEKKRSILKRVK